MVTLRLPMIDDRLQGEDRSEWKLLWKPSSDLIEKQLMSLERGPSGRALYFGDRTHFCELFLLIRIAGQRDIFPPHVLGKPLPVMPDRGEPLLRTRDAVTKLFVNEKLCFHPDILQSLIELVCIWNGNALVKFSVLNEGWSLCIVDRRHGRRERIDLWVAPRRSFQVLSRERVNICVYVIRHPVRNSGPHRNGVEPICVRGQEG